MSVSNGAAPSEECKTAFTELEARFPDAQENLKTTEFLEASKSVVMLVEKFGKVFTPVIYDMNGNIKKLYAKYEEDKAANEFLEAMILREQTEGQSVATDALMWLRRALHFLCSFFQYIVNDSDSGMCSRDLTPFIKNAYSESLEPYHGWLGTQLFNVLSRFVPTRRHLLYTLALDRHDQHAHVIRDMKTYTQRMSACVSKIHNFYNEHHLDT